MSRRTWVGGQLTLAACLFGLSLTSARPADFPTAKVNTTGLAITDDTVTVGQLHSATGTMAISETGSIQAEQLAIEQINAMGGVLGRKIKVIVEDGASDWPTFAEKAKKLLVNDKDILPDRFRLHLAAHVEQDRPKTHRERAQGHRRGRGILRPGSHPVRLPDQQDQAEETGRHLKLTVEKAGSLDVDKIAAASSGVEFKEAPEGYVRIHDTNHHLWSKLRIGQLGADGQAKVLYASGLIEPDPFPKGYQ